MAPRFGRSPCYPWRTSFGTPDKTNFADGMTEELNTEFEQISALKVISHTSVAVMDAKRCRLFHR